MGRRALLPPVPGKDGLLCRVPNCQRTTPARGHLCHSHYKLRNRNGSFEYQPKHTTPLSDVIFELDGTARLPLYCRGVVISYSLIDADDVNWAIQWRWTRTRFGYAVRVTKVRQKQRVFHLHRELLQAPPFRRGNDEVDHFNHDRLDNRRRNIRLVPAIVNRRNMTTEGHAARREGRLRAAALRKAS